MDASKQAKLDKFLSHVNGAYRYDDETGESVKLQPEEGYIHVVRAKGLKDADMYDGSDPYAVVYWNKLEIGRTEVKHDSNDPEFKAKFAIRVPLSELRENVLRVELFDFDDSPLDPDPDFMGQVVLEGFGSEALPRSEVVYPLTRKKEYDGWIHTPTASYENPYNAAVGGHLTLKYSLQSEAKVAPKRASAKPEPAKKSVADSRAPHISAPPLDLSYLKITSPDEIAAAAARQDPPIPLWTVESVRTLKLKVKRETRPSQPRHGFDRSNFTVVSAGSGAQPEPEPEPEVELETEAEPEADAEAEQEPESESLHEEEEQDKEEEDDENDEEADEGEGKPKRALSPARQKEISDKVRHSHILLFHTNPRPRPQSAHQEIACTAGGGGGRRLRPDLRIPPDGEADDGSLLPSDGQGSEWEGGRGRV